MKSQHSFLFVAGWLSLSLAACGSAESSLKSARGDFLRAGASAVEVLRARGYLAKEFFFYTRDGYRISIVRGRNPLFNGGESASAGTFPILFVHGTVDAAPTHLASSPGARPQNFRKHIKKLHKIRSARRLIELLHHDKSTRNLPCLAMNFGYEVWLVNRRGFNRSQGRRGHENRTLVEAIASVPFSLLADGFHPSAGQEFGRPHGEVDDDLGAQPNATRPLDKRWEFLRDLILQGLTLENLPGSLTNYGRFEEQFIQTFNPDYWDFSLDEQAEYDIPDAIEFVLKQTNCSRVHTVGLSSGGALLLLAPAIKPELASKVASTVLWAPALNMGTAKDIVYQLDQLVPALQSYRGPLPFVFMQQEIVGILQALCSTDHQQRNFCSRLGDILFGFSGRQAPIKPIALANFFEPTSTHELFQLGQFAHSSRPCKFEFSEPERNLERYGRLRPPCYDLGRVRLKHISIYVGTEDILVSPAAVNITRSQLRVPVKVELINEPGLFFNHVGSITHDQANRLVLVPSLLDIERAQMSEELYGEAARCHAEY